MKTQLLLSMFAIACSDGDKNEASTDTGGAGSQPTSDDTGEDTRGRSTRVGRGTRSGWSLSIDSDCSMCVLAEIDQGDAGPVTLLVGEEGTPLAPWVKVDADAEAVIPVLELRADTRYTVQVQDDDQDGRTSEAVTSRPGALPEGIPQISLTRRTDAPMQPGLTVTAVLPQTLDTNYVLVLNEDGDVVWYHTFEGMNFGLSRRRPTANLCHRHGTQGHPTGPLPGHQDHLGHGRPAGRHRPLRAPLR